MDIPSYEETLCPRCKNREICNHNKYTEKIRHTTDFTGDMKVSKCKYYVYDKERQNEINRRESIFFIGQD